MEYDPMRVIFQIDLFGVILQNLTSQNFASKIESRMLQKISLENGRLKINRNAIKNSFLTIFPKGGS